MRIFFFFVLETFIAFYPWSARVAAAVRPKSGYQVSNAVSRKVRNTGIAIRCFPICCAAWYSPWRRRCSALRPNGWCGWRRDNGTTVRGLKRGRRRREKDGYFLGFDQQNISLDAADSLQLARHSAAQACVGAACCHGVGQAVSTRANRCGLILEMVCFMASFIPDSR